MDINSSGELSLSIYHSPTDCSDFTNVGDKQAADSSEDIWAADMDEFSIVGNVGETIGAINNITGTWTYSEITDETMSGSIYYQLAGTETYKAEECAVGTSSGYTEHEVDYSEQNGERGLRLSVRGHGGEPHLHAQYV